MNFHRAFWLICFAMQVGTALAQNSLFTSESLQMGCGFQFCVVEQDEMRAKELLQIGENEVSRIEGLISSWNPNSQTSLINNNSGISPVEVDLELFNLISRCLKISRLTDGAFDISFSYCGLWKFDMREHSLPDSVLVNECLENVNWKNIELNESERTVFLKDKGMRISFGAIGKGYAANRASLKMKQAGAKSGLVNASGDLICWGLNEKGEKWPIAVSNPDFPSKGQAFLGATEMAVITSGDYEKFFTHKGTRFSHIINAKTGWPVTDIKSVSIFCPDAELADALSTSIFAMGVTDGMKLANSLMAVECFIIDSTKKKYFSNGLLD